MSLDSSFKLIKQELGSTRKARATTSSLDSLLDADLLAVDRGIATQPSDRSRHRAGGKLNGRRPNGQCPALAYFQSILCISFFCDMKSLQAAEHC